MHPCKVINLRILTKDSKILCCCHSGCSRTERGVGSGGFCFHMHVLSTWHVEITAFINDLFYKENSTPLWIKCIRLIGPKSRVMCLHCVIRTCFRVTGSRRWERSREDLNPMQSLETIPGFQEEHILNQLCPGVLQNEKKMLDVVSFC